MATNKPNSPNEPRVPKVPKQVLMDPALWHLVKIQAATEGIHANILLDRALRRELERVETEQEKREVA